MNKNIYGGSPQQPSQSGQSPQQGSPQPNQPRQRNEGIYQTRTPQEIESLASNAARQGGDFGKVQQEYANQNVLANANRDKLIKAAQSQGIADQRLSELFDFAAARPELRTPEQLVGAYKKEAEQIEKANVPGFWTKLIKGPEARQAALKNQVPVAQALKREGREQEGRSTFSENGLSQTEINYLFYPPSVQQEKAVKELPDGMFKGKNKTGLSSIYNEGVSKLAQGAASLAGIHKQSEYDKFLEKNPKIIEKQDEKLRNFFSQNVTPDTSLLVLRDQLWNKGYAWEQIANAFDTAYPDPNILSPTQKSELTEIHQAPLPSLSDLFGPGFGERLSAITQGKR